jgi:hypothetical protein
MPVSFIGLTDPKGIWSIDDDVVELIEHPE